MIRTLLFTLVAAYLLAFVPAKAEEYVVRGPQGGISLKITMPEGFDPSTGKCPMVILMGRYC